MTGCAPIRFLSQLCSTGLNSNGSSPIKAAMSALEASLQRLDLSNNPQLAWSDAVQDIFCSPAGGPCYSQLDEL